MNTKNLYLKLFVRIRIYVLAIVVNGLIIPIVGAESAAEATLKKESESKGSGVVSKQAYLLDVGGLQSVDELYLVGVMQGIVNRESPLLFLSAIDATRCAGANNVYVNYLEQEKGFVFTRLKTLAEAISAFTAMKRADGVTPLIKGLIKYPTSYWDHAKKARVDLYYNTWIAANFAAQEDLLPVSENILKGKSPMLSGSEFWHKDLEMKAWAPIFTQLQWNATSGLTVKTRAGSTNKGAYASRWVYLDLDVTPKIEVVVSELSPGGAFSLGIRMPTTINATDHWAGVTVPGLTNIDRTGTFVVDLAATGQFNPRSARAEIKIMPSDLDVSVTVKSIRFLDAYGEEPTVTPYVPNLNLFDGLEIKRDLVNAAPYPADEEKACEWSLANQRSQCDPGAVGSFADGSWILKGLDYAIAKKVYLFYQRKCPLFNGGYPNLDKILADLKPPGLVYGWLADESPSCMKMGKYGARYGGGPPENFSFWQWVPLKNPGQPLPFSQVREVKKLENKVYLNFSFASADDIRFSYDLMEGFWADPCRGQVPVTWGLNPLLAKYAPAIAEFYAHTSTPKDSFWGFTAGYTHPSCFPPEILKLYAEETRRGLYELGLSPAVDVWDSVRKHSRTYEELSASSKYPGVKLMSVLPTERGPETFWLENGATVVRVDDRFLGKSQRNGKVKVETIVSDVKETLAQYPSKDPRFLTFNTRVAPSLIKEVQGLLPDNVKIVGMPDFIALAAESGAVVAIPYSDGIGSGDSVKVSFELHNALGETGDAGRVTWNLPSGWSSSPTEWDHGPIPVGSNLKQVVTFTPPEGLNKERLSITYKDSRFEWDKEIFLNTYPESHTVTDCETTEGWSASGGATVSLDRGMIKILPKTSRHRCDFFIANSVVNNNGRVELALKQIDFSRKPILKVNIPDQDGDGTIIGLVDESNSWKKCHETSGMDICSIDLAAVTRWSGIKNVTLTIDPVTKFGSYSRVRSVKICYP